MKTYDAAELFLNTDGRKGENELRESIANGGSLLDADRDGMTAMAIALDTQRQDKHMRAVAPKLVELLKSLGAEMDVIA